MIPKYITSVSELDNLVGLAPKEREKLETVTDLFPFRSNEYYLSLIDWKDGHDPLRRIVVPDAQELRKGGSADPSCEKEYTKQPGLQHKYDQTGLLLLTDVCGGICRFCFRKRLFMTCERETVKDVSANIEYIRNHPEITNVLLTGGDPLTLETRRLEKILRELREIPHVGIIRIGSKMLAYNPYRILNDPDLTYVLSRYSTPEKRIYLMAHFNHPRELTDISIRAAEALQKAGVVVVNQTPILSGINDSPETLTTLFRSLSFAGISPYYVFQCRPTTGNSLFQVPLEESYEILQKSWQACSGLAKRARFVMSHATGKIEIVGRTAEHVFMRYHQAAERADIGKFMVFRSNPIARWFDDYSHALTDFEPKKVWLF
ncbi:MULTISPECIES: KamA family radical SAM protein [unclassified Methanoregula]|uniref:KamA family radical SAM protein n=1 Tax=unclassified Methanoregula TaxID=2649730 RepID=UPI0009C6D9FC|nr:MULTISPECIES: KamA family radical SAM protein [unclassified Methanoregula]OPX64880.1 MAG: L-lysine 2,3-aminomutase [Methanoregula sp. PtaB.Bin085]OPY32932.1 MAG: L-lysine 2,3-aminomutase [Methanoregula sp. PtaU1.Bin006]